MKDPQQIQDIADRYATLSNLLAPTDRELAERRISDLYKTCRLPVPRMIWFDSPLQATMTMVLYRIRCAAVRLCRWEFQSECGQGQSSFDAAATSAENMLLVLREKKDQVKHIFAMNNSSKIGRDGLELALEAVERAGFSRYQRPVIQVLRRELEQAINHGIGCWAPIWESVFERLTDGDPRSSHWQVMGATLSNFDEDELRQILQHAAPLMTQMGLNLISDFYWRPAEARAMALTECTRTSVDEALSPTFIALHDAVSACWQYYPTEDYCFLVDVPSVMHLDQSRNLHHNDEKAVEWANGWGFHALRNLPVDESVAQGKFTAEQCDVPNVELRRVMMERYGLARYLQDTGSVIVHSDEYGTLYRKDIPNDEPIVVVKVINSTPEPDGSRKEYFLRVPQNMHTAREAVAWTFGLFENEYNPAAQT